MNEKIMANYYRALGDENRLLIVKTLYLTDEVCACKFLDVVNCGQSTLSHHLSVLVDSEIVTSRREGKKIIYSCNKDRFNEIRKYWEE